MTTTKTRVPTESQEACAFVEAMKRLGIRDRDFAHPPNEGIRTPAEGARMKREGLSPGLPDYLIFKAVPGRPEIRGVAVELKRRNAPRDENGNIRVCSGGLSLSQKKWLDSLKKHGWLVRSCAGAREAFDWLVEVGYECED